MNAAMVDAARADYRAACARRAAAHDTADAAGRRALNIACGRAALSLARAAGPWTRADAFGRRWLCTWCWRAVTGPRPDRPCACAPPPVHAAETTPAAAVA